MEARASYQTEYPEIPAEVANGRLEPMACWMLSAWTGCTEVDAEGLLKFGRELARLRTRWHELSSGGRDGDADRTELVNVERELARFKTLLGSF